MDRRHLLLLLGAAGTASTAWLDVWGVELVPHRAKTVPGCLDGIPDRDYQYRPRSASIVATSRRAFLLATTVADTQEFAAREAELRAKAEAEAARRVAEAAVEEIPRPPANGEPPRQRLEVLGPGILPAPDESPESEPRLLEGRPLPNNDDPGPGGVPLEAPRVGMGLKRPLTKIRRTQHQEYLPGGMPTPGRLPDPILENARREAITKPLATRLYQLDRASLALDQCEISQVALQLRSDGRWVLSLRADQNRRQDDPDNAPYNPKLYVKRNEFNIRLRCLGGFSIPVTTTSPSAGQPVMAALYPEPFWVENGQPRYLRLVGCERNLWLDLDKIDRVELEFFYR